jgi:CDP-glycerol glycerophosphotransferase
LENIGEELKLKTLIKYHINTHVDIKILKFIENSNNLLFFDKSKSLPDITPLSISDLLITDWSSVFVDYLISNNPILFLDTPMAYNISGVSKVFNNKHISRINSFEGLIKEIRILHEANFKIQQPLRQLKNDIYEGKFDNDNLGRCLKRLERNL